MALVPFALVVQASAVLDSRRRQRPPWCVRAGAQVGHGLQDVAPVMSVARCMRDGIKLNTIINLPANYKPGDKLATVLIRTPYNAKGLMGEAPSWCGLGFALVCQDAWMYASEGEFRMFHDAGYDSHDTVEWITNQPWSNGRVGRIASALALATYLLLTSHNPPAPVNLQVAPIGNAVMHKASFQGGAWRESSWRAGSMLRRAALFDPAGEAHESFDAYSETPVRTGRSAVSTLLVRAAAVPGVHMAGWYDIFSWSQIETVHQLNGRGRCRWNRLQPLLQWLIMVCRSQSFFIHCSRLAGALIRGCGAGTRGPLRRRATNWANVSWGSQLFSQQ